MGGGIVLAGKDRSSDLRGRRRGLLALSCRSAGRVRRCLNRRLGIEIALHDIIKQPDDFVLPPADFVEYARYGNGQGAVASVDAVGQRDGDGSRAWSDQAGREEITGAARLSDVFQHLIDI